MKKIYLLLASLVLSHAPLSSADNKTPLVPITEVFEPTAPERPEHFMKVAVVQSNPSKDAPVGASQDKINQYLQSNRLAMSRKVKEAAAHKAQFVVFSEFVVIGYPDIPELPSEEDEFRTRDDIKSFVDTVPGVSTNYFSKIAKKNNVWIQFGFAEVDPIDDQYYNTVVVINNLGDLVAKFRKISLYQLEHDFLSAGKDIVYFDSPMGRVGLVICADIYNYSVLQDYKAVNVDVLSMSASWAQMNSGFNTFTSAARSQKMYVLAANQNYFPDSGVINPDGTAQSHIRQSKNSIAYGYIPLKEKK